MDHSNKLHILQQAVDLTAMMQEKGEQEQWTDVVESISIRENILNGIFPVSEGDNSIEFKALLECLIDKNEQLTQLCSQQKESLQFELKGITKNKKAVNAYQTV
ncbi:MAG: hypothetical protein COA90_00245 [Gammaproteobacteria bacterium]|nr:MAG: hypothetical protein COA90_00245 [Gammaproteobacteria bacterium]